MSYIISYHHIISYIISYHIISYHIISYHIISWLISCHICKSILCELWANLVPEVFLNFSPLLIFLRMRELRSGENTSLEAARRKNLWLPWTWISLSYRRPGTDARARIWPSVGARIAWYFYKHANQYDWSVWLVIPWDGGDICHCTSWGKFCLSIPPLQPFSFGMSRNAPPKKRLLTPEQHSFHEISQPPLPFHFQNRFRAKVALWNLSNQRMFFIFVSRRGRCHKWTYRFPVFVYGRRKIPATLQRAFYVAEDSSKFKLIIRSIQLKKLLLRRKISILT